MKRTFFFFHLYSSGTRWVWGPSLLSHEKRWKTPRTGHQSVIGVTQTDNHSANIQEGTRTLHRQAVAGWWIGIQDLLILRQPSKPPHHWSAGLIGDMLRVAESKVLHVIIDTGDSQWTVSIRNEPNFVLLIMSDDNIWAGPAWSFS